MSNMYQPAAEQPRGPGLADTMRGVGRLLGRLIAIAVVLAAGVAGWFAVEELAIAAEDHSVLLPELGEGLPTARLDEPIAWRRFQVTYSAVGTSAEEASLDEANERYWFDLDSWKIRSAVMTDSGLEAVEIQGDSGFRRSGADGEWVEQDRMTARNISSYVLGGIGPFLLTDLVPPNALGFTSLELEGTSKGERVYEVKVDAMTLREQHPLAYQRWVASTRIIGDGTALFRIRVREDGYIVRIDGGNSAVIWTDLEAGVQFESPLSALSSPVTAPPNSVIGAPDVSIAGDPSLSPSILVPPDVVGDAPQQQD